MIEHGSALTGRSVVSIALSRFLLHLRNSSHSTSDDLGSFSELSLVHRVLDNIGEPLDLDFHECRESPELDETEGKSAQYFSYDISHFSLG